MYQHPRPPSAEPAHVREASRLLRPCNPAQDVAPFANQHAVDAGDMAANSSDIDEAATQIEAGARLLTADCVQLVAIGGDHMIALPLLRNVARIHGPVAVIHFAAHVDSWDTYFGAPVGHGAPFRRAPEKGHIGLPWPE